MSSGRKCTSILSHLGLNQLSGILLCITVFLLNADGDEVIQRGLRRKAVSELAGHQSSDPDFYLLVIAIDDYQHWTDLVTPVSDAKALIELLQTEYLFDEKRTIRLFNEDATETGIRSALRKLETLTADSDSLFIYYAGHGYKSGHWITYDGETDTRQGWISTADIKDHMRTIPARHILLASDSCFSGDFVMRGIKPSRESQPEMPRQLRTLYNRRSRFALTSGGNEPVKDSGVSKDHSVFAYFLLDALRVNQAPFLIPADEALFGTVRSGVLANPLDPNLTQTPRYGEMIDTGSSSGQFVFFRRNYDASLAKNEVRPIVPIGIDLPTEISGDDDLELPEFSDKVKLLISNPSSGKIRVGRGKTIELTGATRLELEEGRHRFAMRLPSGEDIGGILTVHEVDEEASVTTFGYKRGMFFQSSHLQALREGRPVRYSVRLDGELGEREVISYIMSLQN